MDSDYREAIAKLDREFPGGEPYQKREWPWWKENGMLTAGLTLLVSAVVLFAIGVALDLWPIALAGGGVLLTAFVFAVTTGDL